MSTLSFVMITESDSCSPIPCMTGDICILEESGVSCILAMTKCAITLLCTLSKYLL